MDIPFIIKDFNLIKWIGANSFRTSHYPYSEELMDQADEQGIVIIDETPAVAIDFFDKPVLEQHLKVVTELYQRDKNRPSVVMWSVANEPKCTKKEAGPYFQNVTRHARSLDSTRPITAATFVPYDQDQMAQYLDVLMINRYYGWYSDTGYPQIIYKQITNDFNNWFKKYNKPVMISEYGADTLVGMHMVSNYSQHSV